MGDTSVYIVLIGALVIIASAVALLPVFLAASDAFDEMLQRVFLALKRWLYGKRK